MTRPHVAGLGHGLSILLYYILGVKWPEKASTLFFPELSKIQKKCGPRSEFFRVSNLILQTEEKKRMSRYLFGDNFCVGIQVLIREGDSDLDPPIAHCRATRGPNFNCRKSADHFQMAQTASGPANLILNLPGWLGIHQNTTQQRGWRPGIGALTGDCDHSDGPGGRHRSNVSVGPSVGCMARLRGLTIRVILSLLAWAPGAGGEDSCGLMFTWMHRSLPVVHNSEVL